MSLPDRRSFLSLAAAAALAGCGFTPAFAPGGPAAGLIGRIDIAAVDTRMGLDLTTALEERLGAGGANAPYELKIKLTREEHDFATIGAGGNTRTQLTGNATFIVTARATGEAVAQGLVTDMVAYDISGTTVAERAAARDAERRLARTLADDIIARLITGAADWPG